MTHKLPKSLHHFSPKLGYFQKKQRKDAKNEEKIQKSKIVNKKQEKIAYFKGNFAKN